MAKNAAVVPERTRQRIPIAPMPRSVSRRYEGTAQRARRRGERVRVGVEFPCPEDGGRRTHGGRLARTREGPERAPSAIQPSVPGPLQASCPYPPGGSNGSGWLSDHAATLVVFATRARRARRRAKRDAEGAWGLPHPEDYGWADRTKERSGSRSERDPDPSNIATGRPGSRAVAAREFERLAP